MPNLLIFIWIFSGTFSLIGWGLLVAPLVDFSLKDDSSRLWIAPHLFLLGLLTLTGLALFINFWFPLTHQIGLLTLPIGLCAFVFLKRRISHLKFTAYAVWFASAWVLLALPFQQFSGDAGLYHLQFMQWIAEKPVFLGLAHLQTRFGFDSSWLMFVSMLRVDWLGLLLPVQSPWGHYIVAELIIRAFLYWWVALSICSAVLGEDKRAGTLPLYISLILILTIYFWRMKETSTDVAPNIIAVAAWLCAFQAWFDTRVQSEFERLRTFLVMLCALTFVVISKLSVLPIALMVLPLWWRVRPPLKRVALIVAALAVIVMLWLTRNFLLSGCLIYPAVVTCVDVPWALGVKQAAFETWDIITFARLNGVSQDHSVRDYVTNFSFHWLQLWIPSYVKTFYFRTAIIGILLGIIAAGVGFRNRLPRDLTTFLGVSMIVSAMGYVYWIVLGPDPRFSWVFLFLICLSVMTYGFSKMSAVPSVWRISLNASRSKLCIRYLAVCMPLLAFLMPMEFSFAHDFTTEYEKRDYQGQVFWVTTGGSYLCGDKIPCTTSIHNGLGWIVR